jgi:DNA-binding MarR family transcriptional regulator
MDNFYMRFLEIVSTHEKHQLSKKGITPIAVLFLNLIALKDFQKIPLTVSQAMELRALGSPATLHRKIHELRETGMIEVTSIGTNRRTKYLLLTQAAKDYFQINSHAMLKAVGLK